MATRRARLQVKPNLGPKEPTKQANNSSSSLVKVEKDDFSTLIRLENEKQNTHNTSDLSRDISQMLDNPRQIYIEPEKTTSSDRNEHKETHAREGDVLEGCIFETRPVEVTNKYTPPLANCNIYSTKETNSSTSDPKNETAADQIKDNIEHSKSETSKTDTNGTGIVGRARFRRFGKVNIPGLKSSVKESKTFEKTNDKVPVDANNQNSERSAAVISNSVQVSPLCVPQIKVTEISNKIVDQVDASDTQTEISETFVTESVIAISQSLPHTTDTVNSSKICDEEVTVQTDQLNLSQENETGNLTKIIDKSVSVTVLEKPKEVRQEAESEKFAEVILQEFSTVNSKPRVRLPKVKPNLADAIRRSNKNLVVDKTAESKEGSIQEASTKLSADKEKEKEPVPSSQSQTMTPAPVPLQLMSPVNRSPVKHWIPVLNPSPQKNSADKRMKTAVSISEPPPKKKKQPVIIAPTDQPPDRTKMRMKDLIYWNPTSNPMKSKEKATPEVKDKENKKENKVANSLEDEEEGVEEALMDEDSNSSGALPVPQVTIGPDGSIIINEQSLVVDQKDQIPQEKPEVIDETDVFTTYHSYRKHNRSKSWSAKETAKFYKALGLVGIDFFLIGKLFPTRKHFELKKKFLKEERINKLLIDKVLKEGGRFNMAVFEHLDSDDKEEEKQKNQKKETAKKRKLKKDPEDQKEEKEPKTKKQPKKNKSKNINYFEDSDSEIEEARTARNQAQKKATKISNVDGELLEILLNMREGHLHSSDNGTRVSPQPKVIVEPNQGLSTTFFTNSSQVNMPSQINSQQGQNVTNTTYNSNSQSGSDQFRLVTVSPESGEQVTFEPKPQLPNRGTDLVNSANIVEGEMSTGNFGQEIVQQETPDSIVTTSQGLPQIVTASLPGSGANIELPLDMLNIQSGEDQFVLVTVLPENGEPGETVIHVYRLQGGNVPQVPIQNL